VICDQVLKRKVQVAYLSKQKVGDRDEKEEGFEAVWLWR
jgi:hypothetical protein